MAHSADKPHLPTTELGREWMKWLNGYPVGERIQQSTALLMAGRVGELTIDGGMVEAIVEDGGAMRVMAQILPVDRTQWDLITSLISPDVRKEFRRGGLPNELRSAFAAAEVDVLPERYKEIRTSCTCTDWMKPCRHALAVLRALGEEMERDPMLLIKLRGGGPQQERAVEEISEPEGEELRAEGFWGEQRDWGAFEALLLSGGAQKRLLKRLGPVSVYGVRMEPEAMFKPVYEGVAAEAKVMLEGIRKKVKQ